MADMYNLTLAVNGNYGLKLQWKKLHNYAMCRKTVYCNDNSIGLGTGKPEFKFFQSHETHWAIAGLLLNLSLDCEDKRRTMYDILRSLEERQDNNRMDENVWA